MLRQSFTDFIFATNTDGSGKAASYVRALDMLGDIDLPMGDTDPWGDWVCRDWLKEGVDWWRKEIVSFAKGWPVKA